MKVTVDVEKNQVAYGDQSFAVTMPQTAHEALTAGKWDPIAELLEAKDAVHNRMQAMGWV